MQILGRLVMGVLFIILAFAVAHFLVTGEWPQNFTGFDNLWKR
jgi:hypothetical protein